jgi:hypothetical protein
MARENWVELTSLHIRYWGRGMPQYNQYYAQPLASVPELRSYNQDEVPRNWDHWPLSSGGLFQAPGEPVPVLETSRFQRDADYLAYVCGKKGQDAAEGFLLQVQILPPGQEYTTDDSAWYPALLKVPADAYYDSCESDLFEGFKYVGTHADGDLFVIDNPEMVMGRPRAPEGEIQRVLQPDGTIKPDWKETLDDKWVGKSLNKRLAIWPSPWNKPKTSATHAL